MTEALYTYRAYHSMYDSRQEMPPMWARMGTAWRQDPGNVPEMQIPVLESGTAEEEMTGASLKGKPKSPQHIERMRLARTGKPHPHKGFTHSKETREMQGETMRKNWQDPEYRRRNTEAVKASRKKPEVISKIANATCQAMHRPEVYVKLIGENHPNWQGGITYEPYCPKFNDEFKERVRAFFGYQCVECGALENGERLHIHHVNFNKETCCDSSIPLFVPLCRSCHGKTGHNRPFWQYWFTEMINHQYGGKCYLLKPVIVGRTVISRGEEAE